MKRSVVFVVFFLILGFAVAGLYWSQRRPKSSPVSANAILNMAADAQRDLSRVPMRLTRLSDEREIRIGKDLASRYATQTRNLTPEEEGLEKYVTRVGGTVALRAHRHLPYTFTVLPDHNLINAFSLPGGPVYIGEGMLDLITSEDELANILAHEIEHIDHYHCVERVQVEAQALAVWRAIFLAMDAGGPVRMADLLRAARTEYAKLDRPLTAAEVGGWG